MTTQWILLVHYWFSTNSTIHTRYAMCITHDDATLNNNKKKDTLNDVWTDKADNVWNIIKMFLYKKFLYLRTYDELNFFFW